jgi:FKBP-type peptidyl-prolyl cis-trans isomerase 2
MAPKAGQTVRVHYTGTLSDGSEFDSSSGGAPLEYEMGSGQVIPGFDDAVAALEVGEKTTVTIPACEAYGERMDDGRQEFPLEAFPQPPEVGWMVELSSEDGQRMAAMIAEVGEETAVLDFNHPLAGEDLTFEIELVEVVDEE